LAGLFLHLGSMQGHLCQHRSLSKKIQHTDAKSWFNQGAPINKYIYIYVLVIYLPTYLPTCLPSYLKSHLSIYISTTPYPCPFLFERKKRPLGKTKGAAPMGKLMGNAKPLQQSLACKCFPWQKWLASFLTIVPPHANCLEGLHPYHPKNEILVGSLLANNFAFIP